MSNNLDVLFFDPPVFADGTILREKLANDNCQNKEISRGPHCIASFLQTQGIKSRIVIPDSFFAAPIDNREILLKKINNLIAQRVNRYNPRFIGFSMMFGFRERIVVEMARFAKRNFPDKIIMIGGNHASFVAERLLLAKYETGIDIVVRGEGERIVKDLVSKKDWHNIDGISFRDKGGHIVHNKRRELLSISDLPANDYSLIDIDDDVDIANFNHVLQYARGCSFKCTFCTNEMMWNHRVRPHNIESFRVELYTILALYEKLPESLITILIDDDLLTIKKHWQSLFPILEEARDHYPNVRFAAQARVSSTRKDDQQTHEMLNWAKKINFVTLFLGIESGSQIILDAMGKNCKAEWIKMACKNLKRHGVSTGAFWMFGHPGATVEEEKASLDLLEFLLSEKLLDQVELHMTIPFPGTRMRVDPRVKIFVSEEKEIDQYSIVSEYPIHYLVDSDTEEVVMSPDQIAETFKEGIAIKEKYSGDSHAAVTVASF